MQWYQWVLWAVLVALAANVVVSVLPHFTTRRRHGHSGKGLVIFAESIRWLNVPWGTRTVAAALAAAGFEGEFLYWRWHAAWRGTLVLPCIMAGELLEREAARLAEFVIAQRRKDPSRPIYLAGYSCGGYIATRAMELLPPDVKVDGAVLLAAAMDPRRDLSMAAGHVKGKMVITSSLGDWFILGLGTLLFGTADRVHTPSVGMVGPRMPCPANVIHIPWRPRDLALRHTGGHFGASMAAYFLARIAPHLDLPASGKSNETSLTYERSI